MTQCNICNEHYDEKFNKTCPYCNNGSKVNNALFDNEKTQVYKAPSSDEKTKEFINTKQLLDSEETMMVGSPRFKSSDQSLGTTPLVGWLVVVDGKGKGKDVRVLPGQNSIGRSSDNMICLDYGDSSISRDKHAFIIYDTKHKKFMFKSGEGQNISYLNEEGVYSPMPIKHGDIIELGKTKLMFVPLCGENFNWE